MRAMRTVHMRETVAGSREEEDEEGGHWAVSVNCHEKKTRQELDDELEAFLNSKT